MFEQSTFEDEAEKIAYITVVVYRQHAKGGSIFWDFVNPSWKNGVDDRGFSERGYVIREQIGGAWDTVQFG